MKSVVHLVWLIPALCVWPGSYASANDLDFVDTETEVDLEATMKCDACKIISKKYADAFSELKATVAVPNDEDIINAVESVCDEAWEGYSMRVVKEVQRLAGPDSEVLPAEGQVLQEDPLWSRRLQDMCDELLAEAPDEKTLYNTWDSGKSLEQYLCWSEGLFAACSSDDWGPWPGDDYEDYDDNGEFEGIHDEF